MKIKKYVVMVIVLLLFAVRVNATLITQYDSNGNAAVLDDTTGLHWFPNLYYFAPAPNQGNYTYVESQINSINSQNYFGLNNWGLATQAQYNLMYQTYRPDPEQISDNFAVSHIEHFNMREIPVEERHLVGILAESVMAPKPVFVNGVWDDVWVPGHYLAEMWWRTYLGEDQYLNKINTDGFLFDKYGNLRGYMFEDKYKRQDSSFVHQNDPSYFNYGAWVVADVAPMMLTSAQIQTTSVPEPSTWIMLCIGLVGIVTLMKVAKPLRCSV